MSMFDTFTKKATDTAKAVAKKSGELVETTKLNVNISSEENKISKEMESIGNVIFSQFQNGGSFSTDVIDCCKKIESYQNSIEEMKQKILDLRNVKLCTSCKGEIEESTIFCPKCGTKQELIEVEKVVEVAAENICSSCGEVTDEGAAFCGKCGNKTV